MRVIGGIAVLVAVVGAMVPAAQAAGGSTPEAAMRKGVRDAARLEAHHASPSGIDITCGARGPVGHTARCHGNFRLTRNGRSATYRLTTKAGVFNNSPGSLEYHLDARAEHEVEGLPSRTGIAGFLQ